MNTKYLTTQTSSAPSLTEQGLEELKGHLNCRG